MTRYTDLASKAINYTRLFYEQRDSCQKLAFLLATNIKQYLDAPDGAVQFAELDDELVTNWKTHSIPKLVQGKDGWWYVGILITFEQQGSAAFSKVVLKTGLRCLPDVHYLKLNHEHSLKPGNGASWIPFLESLVRGLDQDYQSEVAGASAPMGFIQSGQH